MSGQFFVGGCGIIQGQTMAENLLDLAYSVMDDNRVVPYRVGGRFTVEQHLWIIGVSMKFYGCGAGLKFRAIMENWSMQRIAVEMRDSR